MDKKKSLESLEDELFQNLPEVDLKRISGGIIATTGGKPGPTHVIHQPDVEFAE